MKKSVKQRIFEFQESSQRLKAALVYYGYWLCYLGNGYGTDRQNHVRGSIMYLLRAEQVKAQLLRFSWSGWFESEAIIPDNCSYVCIK